jgi:hypothetical protein
MLLIPKMNTVAIKKKWKYENKDKLLWETCSCISLKIFCFYILENGLKIVSNNFRHYKFSH